jgi:ribosomal protein L11 methyltransferase
MKLAKRMEKSLSSKRARPPFRKMTSPQKPSSVPPALWRWARASSEKWEDAWLERLSFLGPGRAAVIGWPGSKSVRIEAFVDEKTGRKLVKNFGGRLSKTRDWTALPDQPRKPLHIRGKLTVHGDEKSFAAHSGRDVPLFIPAGMAFGTGEHATTASCLRMLCDVHATLPAGWRAIDAGTGSGILAIAAVKLGASEAEAFDFDPACVRITKANARANRTPMVRVSQQDALQWTAAAKAEVVMANLFSDLLIKVAPRLKRAMTRRGHLIFSGVLRAQLPEVTLAFERLGIELQRTVVRGKWCAGYGRLR